MSRRFEELRENMASELNSDAVWLVDLKERMEVLEGLGKVPSEDRAWLVAFADHDGVMWAMLEEAADLRIKVGQRR